METLLHSRDHFKADLGVEVEQKAWSARNDFLDETPMTRRHSKKTVERLFFRGPIASEDDTSRWSGLTRCCARHDNDRSNCNKPAATYDRCTAVFCDIEARAIPCIDNGWSAEYTPSNVTNEWKAGKPHLWHKSKSFKVWLRPDVAVSSPAAIVYCRTRSAKEFYDSKAKASSSTS